MPPPLEHFTHACAACQKLIGQLLETREDLDRAMAQSPRSPAVAVLQDKLRKLQAATETQFLKAMDALAGRRR